MKYRIVSYCPDTHIEYDGRTPYDVGVGGGITARVRMAKALSNLGHEVRMVVNCRKHEFIDGVEYIPLERFRKAEADVLIMNTSGGGIDLSPAAELDVRAALKIVWLHGTIEPEGLDCLEYDYAYAVSNFVADAARQEWSVTPKRTFVTYNAFEEQVFADAERSNPVRDPYRIVYFSHPSKGLDTAIEIVQQLRDGNSAFHMKVFGGNRLWGERERAPRFTEGITYYGLIGQRDLARELLESSFSLQLQGGTESCPLSAVEAMRAGCIVLASNVRGYRELIKSGVNGFLLEGDHRSREVRQQAAELISELAKNKQAAGKLRRNAMGVPWDTRRAALTWVRHWDLVLQ
ncbi:MAG: glycosyltransferase family 4 protein [Chloroflexi bacterium]|nr:glycosyltransferase family 4 protein [Chloroflexota bacterium]